MTGYSVIESDVKDRENGLLFVDGEVGSKGACLKTHIDSNIGFLFDKFLQSKETYALDRDFWHFCPMLGNGQSVDLLKLFVLVREKGGGDAVSKHGLWELVAKESGFGTDLASSLKLVYIKHLDSLEKWLERVIEGKSEKFELSNCDFDTSEVFKDLGAEFKGFLMGIIDPKYLECVFESNMSVDMELNGGEKCVVEDEESTLIDSAKSVVSSLDGEKFSNYGEERVTMESFSDGIKECEDFQENLPPDIMKSEKVCVEDDMRSVVGTDGGKVCSNENADTGDLDFDDVEEFTSSCKRKREHMLRMLSWVTGIAKNPCDPMVDSLPERSKWNTVGYEEYWKQVLLAREALFLERTDDPAIDQKHSKMHPCMYEDNTGSSYNLRERLKFTKKILPGKTPPQVQACSQSSSLASQTDSESCSGGNHELIEYSVLDLPVEKQIPLGPLFQADVREWTGVSESDSKWLGTRIWPQANSDNKYLIEREPIGKGRQDSCGCEVQNSLECVRFHCNEKLLKLKRELGSAFYLWRFNRMGEHVKLFWTEEEEKKFKAIVRSNRSSSDKSFWDELYKSFPTRRREDLVSYYYNVFLVQRRAYQNRFTPHNIDSDDDEPACIVVGNGSGKKPIKSPGSILYPAKKARKNV